MHTDPSPLVLEQARGTAMKISLNVLHKDPNLTIMTLPIEGIELVQEQLDAFMGKHTFRSWYDQRPDGSWHPCAWWLHRDDADYPIDAAFHTDRLILGLSGDQVLEFERQEPEDDDDDAIPAAKITSIRLKPTPGGVTLLALHIQVRPGLGKDNLLLQEHQFRPITITLGETKVAPKKGKQQSLPLGGPAQDPPQEEGNTREESGHGVPLTNEQLDELQRARQGGVDATVWLTNAVLIAIGSELDALVGYTVDNPRPFDKTDSEVRSEFLSKKHSAEFPMDPDLESQWSEFERDAKQRIDEFADRNNRGVWDGRSERVKHQDAQAELEAPKFPANTTGGGEEAA